jgi:hypothetical protein
MSEDGEARGARCWLPYALLAVGAGAALLWLFHGRADAVFVLYDPAFYGTEAERAGLASINGHHPLFHVLALVFARTLTFCGADEPGFLSLQLINAGALTALILALGKAARWRKPALGVMLLLLSMRGFVLSAAGGETLLPALAASVWLLLLACDASQSQRRVGAMLVLTLLLRQDSILVLPAVLFARSRCGFGVQALARFTLITGLVTLSSYIALWKLSGRDPSLVHWLFALMEDSARTWGGTESGSVVDTLLLHANAWVVAATGHFSDLPLLTGAMLAAGIVAIALLAQWLLGLSAAQRTLALATLLALLLRYAFSMWFEPHNWEWALMGWVYVMLLLCALADSGAQVSKPEATLGFALMLVLAATIAMQHISATMDLRAHRLSRAAVEAIALGTHADVNTVYAASSPHAQAALFSHGIEARNLDVAAWTDLDSATSSQVESIAKDRPTVILLDRAVGRGFGSQAFTGIPPWLQAFDQMAAPKGIALQRMDGKVWVLGLNVPQ